jgi:hypothetical protein
MRLWNVMLAVVTLAGLGWTEAKAQLPLPDPRAKPVFPAATPPAVDSPAYQQFLNSTSSVKTYSRLTPSSGVTRITPFSIESRYVEPGYLKQRVSPYGFESVEYVPGYGAGYRTPFEVGGYQVSGYYRTYFAPPVRVVPARP